MSNEEQKLDPKEDDVFDPSMEQEGKGNQKQEGDGDQEEGGGEEDESVLALNKRRVAAIGILFVVVLFGVALFGVYGGGGEKKKKKSETLDGASETSAAEEVSELEERSKEGEEPEKPADQEAKLKAKDEKELERAEKLQKKLEDNTEESEEEEGGGGGESEKGPWEKAQEQAKRRRARAYFKSNFDAKRSKVFAEVETSGMRGDRQPQKRRPEGGSGGEQSDIEEMERDFAETREKLVERVGQRERGGGTTQQEEFLEETDGGETQNFHRLQEAVSEHVVQAGTMLPLVLETGINSELPGFIRGRFARPVYDSVTGEHLLIPSGSTVVGKYNARTEEGQSRAQVVWTRLLMPNGKSLKLGGIPGADLQGQAGYHDKVDNQWGEVGAGVVLTSLLSAGAGAASGTQSDFQKRPEQGALNAAGQNISKTGEDIVGRELDKKPVVKIRPGMEVSAYVHEDLVLEPYSRR